MTLHSKAKNMNLSKIAPLPEHNYLSISEYAQIVGIALGQGEIDLIESVAAKICAFRGIATVQAFDTREIVTAYPVTVLVALFDLYLRLVAADPPPTTDNTQN
jgi:hypothetical protein